jgi:hypothetical protein
MKTAKMLAILVLMLVMVGNLAGQNSQVKFRATVTADEDHNIVPVCYGDYFVEVAINDILEDANAVLTGIASVQVCYSSALGLVLGDNVEVYGYYWGGICPKQYCGRVQIIDDSFYIMRIEEYGDNDWMVSGNNMYAIPPGNIGIGTTSPAAPLDVRRSAPGTNVVAAFFTNPSDAVDSAVSIDLGIGTALPTEWRLKATHNSLEIGNAVILPPAITIGNSNKVAISNGLNVGGGGDVAVHAASGMIPLILITGKHGVVTFGQDYGIYAWGGQKAGYFSGDVSVSGNLGIGTTNPGSYKLAVNGSAAKTGGGSWSVFSDVRLKNINGGYEHGLSEIIRLNPVRYNYKENNELQLPTDNECVGLVAQEVQSVIPEAVEENSKGYLMVNNDPIIWAMVNAIKQLKTENDQLKQRLDTLEQAINKQNQLLQNM